MIKEVIQGKEQLSSEASRELKKGGFDAITILLLPFITYFFGTGQLMEGIAVTSLALVSVGLKRYFSLKEGS